MNILLVAERYWPEVGAAPSRLANMAEGLQSLGNRVNVLTALPNYPEGRIFKDYRGRIAKKERHAGVRLFRYWMFATVSRKPLARIVNMFSFALTLWLFAFKWRRIKSYDLVIIQTPTLVTAASAMVLFKKVFHKKCVLNVSDLWPSTAVDMGAITQSSASYKFLARLERFLYNEAHAVLGQSNEILQAVRTQRPTVPAFLYRNLQRYKETVPHVRKSHPMRLVFCGMLGVAQNVAGIVRNINFSRMGVEFHILGGGKQLNEIEQYIQTHPDCGVKVHGFVPKEEIPNRLQQMDVSIVPLAQRIRGAVPSKIYDILPQGIPILFCGGGEGAQFIESHRVGLVSAPGDYEALAHHIQLMAAMSDEVFARMSQRCIDVSRNELNFDRQMLKAFEFLEKLST